MNYGEMKARFLGLLNNRQCTPSLTASFIDSGIARCQRKLRCPAMEKGLVVTIGTPYSGLWIPGDYLELIRIENSYGKKLTRKSLDYVKCMNGVDVPQFFARQVNKWVLGPTPAQDDTVRIDYYAEFGGLSAEGDENLLSIIAPDLPIYAALSFAADYFIDDRAPLFEARFAQILGELNDQADNDDLADANVEQAFGYPDD